LTLALKEVNIIADTGAQDNYIRNNVVRLISTNHFPIDHPCEVAGAGHTINQGSAQFILKIGTIEGTILAYVPNKSMYSWLLI